MKRLIGLALLCCGSAASASTFFTGNQLLEKCDSSSATDQVGCVVYVMGILDGATINSSNAPYRLPETSTSGQLKDVVIAYLKAHPEKRHWPASLLIWNAMVEAFPAPKQP